MDKLIPLNKGIHRQPSVGADGELSELVNLIPQNGELVNVRGLARNTTQQYEEMMLVYIHAVQGADNLVFTSTTSRDLIYERDGAQEAIVENLENFKSITSVGNTLVVLDGEYTRYFIWRGSKYVEYDFANAGFKMRIESEADEEWSEKINYTKLTIDANIIPNFPNLNYTQTLSPSQLEYLYHNADTYINEYISKMKEPSKWHKYVTFGIAALRLSDESYIVFSDIFTLDPKGEIMQSEIYYNGESDSNSQGVVTTLSKYKVTVESDFIDGEIVTGIDFFLTQPYSFIKYDTEKEIKVFRSLFDTMSVEEMQEELSSLVFRKAYSVKKYDFTNNQCTFEMPKPSEGEKELSIADIPSYVFCSSNMFSYNGRLNLVGSDTYLHPMRKGHCIQKAVKEGYGYKSGEYDEYRDPIYEGVADYVIKVICEDDTYGEVTNYYYEENAYYPLPPVLSYPSRDVKKMQIFMRYNSKCYVFDSSREKAKIQNIINGNLSLFFFGKYPYINSGFWSDELEDEDFEDELNKAKNHSRRIGSESNTVKYSEYGNPFVLPPVNSIQVGNEKIVGASTSAKALSQGQFGQFPLYVFCTDGIWALEVGSDGSYTSVTPVSRDACNNPDSITQIDGAVVFTTGQGLKLIQGSDVMLLSDKLDGHNVNEEDFFKEINGMWFFEYYGMEEFDKLVNPETRDIRDILKDCRIAYDYANQLLRIFPKRQKNEQGEINTRIPYKYYVYSFTTQEFATVVGNEFDNGNGSYEEVATVVAAYPSSVIQIGNKLYRPMETEREGLQKGLLLTRPIMLDEPFALKKLQDMRLHYSKFDGTSKCHVVVYVSNDGTNWAPMRSLRKRSYKYYRFAIITEMKDMDALSGMVLRYEVERNNKLR